VAASYSLPRLSRRKLSVAPRTKWDLERETGLEPATFSLEGLDLYAVWRASWKGVHFVSSYRVVAGHQTRPPSH